MPIRALIFHFALAALWTILAFPDVAFSAGPEIFLQEEPETYLVIDKLEGMGFLPELMTGDRGLEALEVAREAGKAGAAGDPFTDGMIQFLRLGGEKRHDFRLRVGIEHSGDGRVPPNAQGLPVLKNGDVRAGGFFRAYPVDWLSFQARGDILLGFSGEDTGRIEETSLRLGWPQATLEAGRFSLWWGPGRHGSIIMSTNAQPLIGARLRNPRPISLGRPLRFLGEFQYDLFLARLEKDRPVPHPLLFGMRLAVRPNPHLEIGVSRTMQYGGEGRGNGLSDWWEAFKGRKGDEEVNVANHVAGFDLSIVLPFKAQPVKIYLEAEGEDQRVESVPYPYKWAFLSGVFFPSLLRSPRADLRVELAMTDFRGHGSVWYVHSDYPHRYRGEILGHHMGTDARDLFIEAHYFLLPSSYLEANVDFTQRDFPGPEREDTRRVSVAIVAWLTRNIRAEARLAFENISNENGTFGQDGSDVLFQTFLSYQYR